MRVAALEPYATPSHVAFLDGWRARSRHELVPLTLPARGWKWRMRTSALHYATLLAETGPWDAIVASDYVNLAELLALLPPPLRDVPSAVVFHENQLTYPLHPGERRDHQFAFTHLYAALAASAVVFNSEFHRRELLDAFPALLGLVPDVETAAALETVRARSRVLPLGLDVPAGEPRRAAGEPPVVLWSHRFEHDKDPDAFVDAVVALRERPFRVRLLGARFRDEPPAFARLRDALGERVDDRGFLPSRADYLDAVRGAHVVVSTARHEFFGLAAAEAIRAGLVPVLPNELAYPELIPEELHGRFLYERESGAAPALARALDLVERDDALAERAALIAHTDRLTWDAVAPRWDALVDELGR